MGDNYKGNQVVDSGNAQRAVDAPTSGNLQSEQVSLFLNCDEISLHPQTHPLRKLSGAFLLASRLGARVDSRRIWERAVEKYEFSDGTT